MTNRRRFRYEDSVYRHEDLEGKPRPTVASKDPAQLTFVKLVTRLTDDHAAYVFLEELRWADGVRCPHCGSLDESTYLAPRNETVTTRKTTRGTMSQRRVWKCRACRKQFSVLTDTIFHGSHVPVRVWVLVLFQMASSKNGMAAKEVERTYGLAPQTAWFVCHRIRMAMERSAPDMLVGTIVADETWIGGKPRNRHVGQRHNAAPSLHGRPGAGKTDKTAVFSLIERESGEVRSRVVPDVTGATLYKVMSEQVDIAASELQTDEGSQYRQIGTQFANHETVNHSLSQYVRYEGAGLITTNQAEGYFSQLKRSIDGTHHSVSKQHLPRYLAEFDFRYSTRRMTDTDRMLTVIQQADGRRLAFKLCR